MSNFKESIEEMLKKVKLLELENEILKSQNKELTKLMIEMQDKLKEWIK